MRSPFEAFIELTRGEYSLQERRQRIIDIGLSLTGFETGIVTEKHDLSLCFLNVRTTDGSDLEMDPIPIAPSVCGLVVHRKEPLFLADVSTSEFADFPGVVDLGLTAYAGVPLILDDEVTGTLCFTETRPIDSVEARLGPAEKNLLRHLGAWLSDQHQVEAHAESRRKEREMALMLQTVFDGMELQASFMTPDGVIVRSNRATLENQQITPEEIEGTKIWDAPWVREEAVPELRIDVERAAEGETIARHVKILLPDGQLTDIDYSLKPIFDSEKKIRYLLGEARDITSLIEEQEQQLALERKLQEAQKLESLGVLAGGIAHDFNNFLTGILGNANYLRTAVASGSELDCGLAAIEDAAQKSADLCQQMLAYSGRSRFVVEPICLNDLIQSSAELLRASISKSTTFEIDLQEGLSLLDGDATQLSQIVMNVVINASEALPDTGGVIRVRTQRVTASAQDVARLSSGNLTPGDYLSLEIADDGEGMEQSTLSQIFDPFFTTKFTGRGLGLAAVLGIVRAHSAGLRVESNQGTGTCFEFLFPISTGSLKQKSVPRVSAHAAAIEGKVLVIDDVAHVRDVAGRMFKRLGLDPILANDGRHGIQLFEENREECVMVFLDLTMPQLDGPQTFHELRKRGCEVPIVVMSGYTETEISERFIEESPAAFLQKPITLSSLGRTIALANPLAEGEPLAQIESSCSTGRIHTDQPTVEREVSPTSEIGQGGSQGGLPTAPPADIRGALVGLSALVVDDQSLVRKACRQSCGLLGIETVEAGDLASARAIVEEEIDQLDLALIDLRLPDGSGTELVRHLRAARPDMVIVLMTGLDAAEAIEGFGEDPRTTSLQKPFGVRDLLTTLWPSFGHTALHQASSSRSSDLVQQSRR